MLIRRKVTADSLFKATELLYIHVPTYMKYIR